MRNLLFRLLLFDLKRSESVLIKLMKHLADSFDLRRQDLNLVSSITSHSRTTNYALKSSSVEAFEA